MQACYLARQAIYDRELGVFAYELLFRDGDKGRANISDGNSATSQVILNAFLDMGLDKLVGDKRAFINLTQALLIHEDTRHLPKECVVLEVLEDVRPTAEIIAALRQLADAGFCIALDDFFYDESLQALVELADIIKIDILPLSESEIEEQVKRLRGNGRRLLAEKVETAAQFEFCKALGFDYFQGYFIARPNVIQGRRPPANRLATLQLLGKLQKPQVDLDEIEGLISADITLSYRVLRTINSPLYHLPRKVESIRTAVQLLGIKQLKHLVTLIALANFDDKPSELIKLALIRAKFSESLGAGLNSANADICFSAGLFSMLDALLDHPMAEILKELPLSDELSAALLHHAGEAGAILKMAKHYERGEWEQVVVAETRVLDVGALYLDALAWVERSMAQLQA